MSAVGDVFAAIATRAGKTVAGAVRNTKRTYSAGQTGLLRLTWDNGDRTVLVNPALGGVTFGWNLHHTAADELFAAVEGSALHTRIIFNRMEENGAPSIASSTAAAFPSSNARPEPDLRQRAQQARARPRRRRNQHWAPSSSRSSPPATSPPSRTRRTPSARPYRVFEPQPAEVARYDRLFRALPRRLLRPWHPGCRPRRPRPHPAGAARHPSRAFPAAIAPKLFGLNPQGIPPLNRPFTHPTEQEYHLKEVKRIPHGI